MALDGIVIHALVEELQRCIGARIHKIHQPTNNELVFSIRGAGAQGKLLLSANPTYPRIHWTNATHVNPMEAPMFCMLMRKYCEGATIEAVRQVGRERIIHMDVRHRDELGDISFKTIVIEIMGRHSNIILLDPSTGTIHDGIHHVTPAISSFRIVMPGSRYTAPPDQGKVDPLDMMNEDQFKAAMTQADTPEDAEVLPPQRQLVQSFSGLSPLLAKEIVYRAETGSSSLWSSFQTLMNEVRDHVYNPTIAVDANGKAFFSITQLTHIQGSSESYATISECLEAFYGDKAERDTVKQRALDLIRFVQNEKAKNEKKIEKLQETVDEAQDADKYRVLGELLTAYMHQINRGDKSVELINFYDEEQAIVKIDLDVQLTPSDNAQRYFRKYTKQKNSIAVVEEQMAIAQDEITYMETLLQQLDNASLADIVEIREELVEQGYLRNKVKRGPKKKKAAKPTLLCYTSSEGVSIYVGKNNTQNEYLTNRLASPSDVWLHTKDIPGSHVVIRGGDFGDVTLEEAAMLSGYYSQARESSMIPVDYTFIRHVRKPSGAKPGFVIYDHQKTLFITPDEQRIKALPSRSVN
ncbi:NFACT RNA binding domain-containing protein [Paenibacillus lupini]|uniref:Rqc2 family fibronectin-binding protein n=1 Tax=Paenibacillus lupini TaxID=1450204 RepID=UPI001423851A|nr:NFACT RNA binding domain-containing protein [Paenibacillus lupini]NIK22609.1 putative ribosome quality control (RQC) complex YloA/Tae2 family protein [Paenibacillus lupini]